MVMKIITKIFRRRNDRTLRRMRKNVDVIGRLETEMEKISDYELQAKTQELRARLEKCETLEKNQTEAFAVVRE
ncbi:hypothetical protein H4F33_21560, partial [Pectobacterium brasiliense]|uniref:hypothetical protein n=1 Tax=Pectobacterium brasiliense TaxID=180957 RepID=UPI00196988E9